MQKSKVPLTQSPVKMNMSMTFKKFQNKILMHVKTFDVTIRRSHFGPFYR